MDVEIGIALGSDPRWRSCTGLQSVMAKISKLPGCLQNLIKHDHKTIVRHNGQTMMKCDRNMVNTQCLGSTRFDEDVHRPL